MPGEAEGFAQCSDIIFADTHSVAAKILSGSYAEQTTDPGITPCRMHKCRGGHGHGATEGREGGLGHGRERRESACSVVTIYFIE